jgi:ribose transport system ATP-binding protein
MEHAAPLLEARGLCKSYAVRVLDKFDLDLRPGEVHALMGANGAGKSTLARILCGLTPADAGTMRVAGSLHAPRTRREAEAAGVVMVLQELNVIRTLTVAENLFLDRLPRRLGMVDRKTLERRAAEALARVGLHDVPPRTPAGQLGVGQQQLVEIAGALARDCRVLILDEPTAALTDPEIGLLFANIRRLQDEGVGILYISHRMDEIRRIADRITVLRDGKRVAAHPAGDVTPRQLVREMSGHDLPMRDRSAAVHGAPALRVGKLSRGERVREVGFTLHQGEILGVAGLIGSGRTEMLRAIFGADRAESGSVRVGEGERRRFASPSQAVAAGIGMVPEDRKQDALLLPQPLRVNATLASLSRHARGGWLRTESETAAATAMCDRLGLQCSGVEQAAVELSGGNQQKLAIGRWLERDCDVLLCDEPTRGVDAAATDAIHALLRKLARTGKGILVVSSELEELMSLCDRILVMSAGRIVAEFAAGEWTHEEINAAAFSGHLGPQATGSSTS